MASLIVRDWCVEIHDTAVLTGMELSHNSSLHRRNISTLERPSFGRWTGEWDCLKSFHGWRICRTSAEDECRRRTLSNLADGLRTGSATLQVWKAASALAAEGGAKGKTELKRKVAKERLNGFG